MVQNEITYQTAKLAFEKKYPVYNNISKSNFYNRRTKNLIHFGRTGTQGKEHMYAAPKQELLNKYLREKHQIIISIQFKLINEFDIVYYALVYDVLNHHIHHERRLYRKYEEALENALQVGLKLIKC